jgi:hypothetical protein
VKRALLVSPHFPPDTSAGTHRVRLLAPHLGAHGWEPTVLTVTPESYEGQLDPALAALVPESLRVVRVPALPAGWTRRLGLGDLGLRALPGLHREAARLLRQERFDLLFITIYPTYPALLGPLLKSRFGIPFVLDYQDPWVGSWGETVGGAADGAVDAKSFLTRRLSERLEPWTARHADALTAVSAGTYGELFARHPELAGKPVAAIPLGGEPADFAATRAEGRANGLFDPEDGRCHLVYVGTLLPLGFETLRALFAAVARLKEERPEIYGRLALHFVGTSNQTDSAAPPRALPEAERAGIAEKVTEHPPRVGYTEALRILTQAHSILLLGSSEPHYTPSKAYPALLAGRPVLAAYHEASEVVPVLAASPAVRLVTYGVGGAGARIPELARDLADLVEHATNPLRPTDLEEHSAAALAGRLARLFDKVSL